MECFHFTLLSKNTRKKSRVTCVNVFHLEKYSLYQLCNSFERHIVECFHFTLLSKNTRKKTRVTCCLVLRRFLGFSTVVARKDDGKASKTQRHKGKQSQGDCCKWWGTVIRLTGSSGNALSYSLECDREVLNEMALADILCFCG